jgi:hypothetical protein
MGQVTELSEASSSHVPEHKTERGSLRAVEPVSPPDDTSRRSGRLPPSWFGFDLAAEDALVQRASANDRASRVSPSASDKARRSALSHVILTSYPGNSAFRLEDEAA